MLELTILILTWAPEKNQLGFLNNKALPLKGTMIHSYLVVIEWGGYEEFCRYRMMLFSEAEGQGGNPPRSAGFFISYESRIQSLFYYSLKLKYFPFLKGVSPVRSLFFYSPKITHLCPQVFSVNGSITCSGLHFWRRFDVIGSM